MPPQPADLAVVAGQLGRRPRGLHRVVARCPHGFPAAVEDLPYDERGRPFPTLYYCTCPTLVAAVSRLESAGGVAAWRRRLEADPQLLASLRAATAATRRRRRALMRFVAAAPVDGGASLALGVGGVREPRGIKCLHAHVAHALARRGYRFGEEVLLALERPWCDDRRCAAFLPGGREAGGGRRGGRAPSGAPEATGGAGGAAP